ncbi:MAG: tol-pal system-associated acyl-CoA thioesterase [Pseudomonadales bacterium]
MAALFQWPIRVYIEDTDAGGIVYYVNYLKFMERARTEYLRSLGFSKAFIFNADLMFVVHSTNSEYLQPARLDDELIATAQVVKSGKAFLVLAQKVYRSKTGSDAASDERELLCQAEVKLACVDKHTIKPKRIPDEILAAFQPEQH